MSVSAGDGRLHLIQRKGLTLAVAVHVQFPVQGNTTGSFCRHDVSLIARDPPLSPGRSSKSLLPSELLGSRKVVKPFGLSSYFPA